MDKIPTICPYCGCGRGLYLHVDKGTIVGVSPSRSHPVNKGSLCVKGWNCYEFIQHPDRRITTTLEARMKCGMGKCGQCFHGTEYICTNGPVYTYEEIKKRKVYPVQS